MDLNSNRDTVMNLLVFSPKVENLILGLPVRLLVTKGGSQGDKNSKAIKKEESPRPLVP